MMGNMKHTTKTHAHKDRHKHRHKNRNTNINTNINKPKYRKQVHNHDGEPSSDEFVTPPSSDTESENKIANSQQNAKKGMETTPFKSGKQEQTNVNVANEINEEEEELYALNHPGKNKIKQQQRQHSHFLQITQNRNHLFDNFL
jgi:hypothetical protein